MIVTSIEKSKILPSEDNSRESLEDIEELRELIKQQGLINPITVHKEGEFYRIDAGNRRFAAYSGNTIPCNVLEEKDLTISAAENLCRKSLHIYEQAIEFNKLINNGYSIGEIADILDSSISTPQADTFGKGGHGQGRKTKKSTKEAYVNNILKIFSLPEQCKKLLRNPQTRDYVSKQHIIYLVNSGLTEEQQIQLMEEVIANQMPTSMLRQMITYFKTLSTRAKQLKPFEETTGEKFKDTYGFIPDSTWYSTQQDNKGLRKFISRTYTLQIDKDIRNYDKTYSEFLPELAYRIIVLWSNINDIVVDPMAGHGIRGMMAWGVSRNVYLFDCCKKFIKKLQDQKTVIEALRRQTNNRCEFNVECCDSRHMPLNNNYVDMIFTCPPYWNLEKYPTGGGQLTDINDYEDFLTGMNEIMADCYRILKPAKFMVLVVADFRVGGNFYNFHGDVINLCNAAGFELWDIVISKLTTNVQMKVAQHIKHNRVVKTHEYVIVFKKEG